MLDHAGAITTAIVVKSGQPSLAASATYAALLAGQKHTVNNITKTLVDQVRFAHIELIHMHCFTLQLFIAL